MPYVWGGKYLKELGIESWEELRAIARLKVQEDIRQWKEDHPPRPKQDATQPPPNPAGKVTGPEEAIRRYKRKTNKTKKACKKAKHEHQTAAPANDDSGTKPETTPKKDLDVEMESGPERDVDDDMDG